MCRAAQQVFHLDEGSPLGARLKSTWVTPRQHFGPTRCQLLASRAKTRSMGEVGLGTVPHTFLPRSVSGRITLSRCGTGVIFGHKLLSPRSILRAIGYPEPPARGSTGAPPSFADDNRKQNRGR